MGEMLPELPKWFSLLKKHVLQVVGMLGAAVNSARSQQLSSERVPGLLAQAGIVGVALVGPSSSGYSVIL